MTDAKILLIDDDLNLLGAMARFLRDEGFEVRVCDQPHQALDLISTWQPALIVSDLKMPGLSGLEVLAHVRQKSPQLPVLLFSAFATTPDVVAAIELGAAGFLEKTQAPDALREKIQDVLAGRATPLRALPKSGAQETPLTARVRAFERTLIEQALKDAGGSVKGAMETLGLSRRTMNEKMARLGVQRGSGEADANPDESDESSPT